MSDRYPQFPPETLSVTEVIKAAGLMPESDFIDPWFLGRGQAAHAATEYFDKGTIDESTVSPEIAGMLASWKKYRETYTPTHIEHTMYDPLYKFCGKVDRLPLLDIKGPGKSKWQRLQLGAYWYLCGVNGLTRERREPKVVHLDPDGAMPKVDTFTTLEMIEYSKDFLTILAALRIKEKYL